MIYLIYGFQLPVIKKTLKQTIQQCLNGEEMTEFNVEKYSARETPVQDIVFSASSLPLGSSHKVIVVQDPYFLLSEKEKCSLEKDQDYECLQKYLENPSPYCDLIFFLESMDLNKKSAIYKVLKTKGKIMEQEVLTEEMLHAMGEALFIKKGRQIRKDALDELVHRCGNDVSKFTSEATKLSLYKDDITLDDVELMVASRLEDNAFAIADNLIRGKTKDALKTYYDLRVNKEEPIRLISVIASQFRFMNMVAYLSSQNKSIDQMAIELKCKPYRVQVNQKSLVFIKQRELQYILDYLYKMDLQIKTSERDPYFIFELFILNFDKIKMGK